MDTVIVGSIGAPHGVRGWVKINSFTEPLDNIFSYQLLIESKDMWLPIKIVEFKPHATVFVARLENIVDRDQAALLTNLKLAVERESLPALADDEYYWNDLIGLTVINEEKIELGKIADYFATGANGVIVVRGAKGKEYLIPYVPGEFVLEIDLANSQMRVHWDAEF